MCKNSDRGENDGATDIIADSLHINHIFAVSCSDQSTAVLCACLFVYLEYSLFSKLEFMSNAK